MFEGVKRRFIKNTIQSHESDIRLLSMCLPYHESKVSDISVNTYLYSKEYMHIVNL
jgi:hypothetical protein